MNGKTILVTGASGLIGVEVAAGLLAAGYRVLATVHRQSSLVSNSGATLRTREWHDRSAGADTVLTLRADVSKPRLGLDSASYERLQKETDLVVHVAAVTEFGLPKEAYEQVNLRGTANVLQLTRGSAGRWIPLIHVSTAYVCGDRSGEILEDELECGQRFSNDYERTKCEAERLVRAAQADGQPAIIMRPSIVVGEQRRGVIRDFKNIYVVLRLAIGGRVKAVPGLYSALLDLVPLDEVRDLILATVGRFSDYQGTTLHAVGASPLSLREFSDVLAEYPSFRVPRIIPPASFTSAARGGPASRLMDLYEPYFSRTMVFRDNRRRELLPPRSAVTGKKLLRLLLDYALEVGYLTPRPLAVRTQSAARD